MSRNKRNRLHLPLLSVLAIGLFSSCNRGYGCPTNLSADLPLEAITQVLQALAVIL